MSLFILEEGIGDYCITLAELSGKSVDTIKKKSTSKPFYALMNDYKIHNVAFQRGMHEKAELVT